MIYDLAKIKSILKPLPLAAVADVVDAMRRAHIEPRLWADAVASFRTGPARRTSLDPRRSGSADAGTDQPAVQCRKIFAGGGDRDIVLPHRRRQTSNRNPRSPSWNSARSPQPDFRQIRPGPFFRYAAKWRYRIGTVDRHIDRRDKARTTCPNPAIARLFWLSLRCAPLARLQRDRISSVPPDRRARTAQRW
jgi:hypothetical protein